MKAFAIIMGTFACVAHISHLAITEIELQQSENLHETLPSEEALRLTSLGYRELVADYYWLRTISHFGTREMHVHLYPNLEPLIRRVLALDPYFESAYKFAGTTLTLNGMDPTASTELLRKGVKFRPDVWRIPFYLGFNAYFFEGDYVTAADAMAKAARMKDAPEVAGLLATRLAAEARTPEIGLRLIDTILEDLEDDRLREVYVKRRALLVLEVQLNWLSQAADRFEKLYNQRPKKITDLKGPGLMREIFESDPLGGRYFIDEEGNVKSSNDEKRLRIQQDNRNETSQ